MDDKIAFVKLTLAGDPDRPILVRSTHKPHGQELDLDLIATDGTSAYRLRLREKKVNKYRADSYDGSAEEWANILRHVLLPHSKVNLRPALLASLQSSCRQSGSAEKPGLIVDFQTHVDEIKHKLGSLELARIPDDEAVDIDLFDWLARVVDVRDAYAKKAETCQSRMIEAESTLTALQKQMDEMIVEKNEHELQLLAKCAALLNEKKLKIRIQQRYLAAIGDGKMGPMPARNKRKTAEALRREPEPSNGDSDGFEAMEVDRAIEDHSEASDIVQNTPSISATTSEPGSDVGEADSLVAAKIDGNAPASTDIPFVRNTGEKDTKRSSAASQSSPIQHFEDDETASEDDEL